MSNEQRRNALEDMKAKLSLNRREMIVPPTKTTIPPPTPATPNHVPASSSPPIPTAAPPVSVAPTVELEVEKSEPVPVALNDLVSCIKNYRPRPGSARSSLLIAADAYSRITHFCYENQVSAAKAVTYLLDEHLPKPTQVAKKSMSAQGIALASKSSLFTDQYHIPTWMKNYTSSGTRCFTVTFTADPYISWRLEDAKRNGFRKNHVLEALIVFKISPAPQNYQPLRAAQNV